MKLRFGIDGCGARIELSVEDAKKASIVREIRANQTNPQGFYTYAHTDSHGAMFYIGKGTSRRAWNDERHELWHYYVDKYLEGKYSVEILNDNLSSVEAEELENEWMAMQPDSLVNWINFARKYDPALSEKYWNLRRANEVICLKAKASEKALPDLAIELYRCAIKHLDNYATINACGGLVGRLIQERLLERGSRGNISIIERLTLCLVKAKRIDEAVIAAHDYFEKYRGDLMLSAATSIMKRVSKSKLRPDLLRT